MEKPTPAAGPQYLKTRAVRGVASLISRSLLLQLVSVGGYFFLTVILARNEIGIFYAVTEIVSILGYFSDIGLAAALVQKKSQPDISDLRTTFTLQQILVCILITLALLLSPVVKRYYYLTPQGFHLFVALLISFFLSSLKTIPSVILEREVKFETLAFVEVVETLLFYILAVVFAARGFGVASYTIAILCRSVVGTLLLYIFQPWKIGLSLSGESFKSLLKFGVPYQANTFLAVIKDRFINLILFRSIGADGVGILSWAQTWSQKPLRLIMDNVTKVTFPTLSRLQDNPALLARALELSLFYSCSLIFPILAAFGIFAQPAISLSTTYHAKWHLGLVPLYFYLFSSALAAISTPLTNALNAIGKIRYTFYLMIMWTSITLLTVPLFASRFGYVGVAYATGLIALTSFVPLLIARKFVPFSVVKSIVNPALSTVLMGVLTTIALNSLTGIWGILAGVVVGATTYPLLVIAISGKSTVRKALQTIRSSFQ